MVDCQPPPPPPPHQKKTQNKLRTHQRLKTRRKTGSTSFHKEQSNVQIFSITCLQLSKSFYKMTKKTEKTHKNTEKKEGGSKKLSSGIQSVYPLLPPKTKPKTNGNPTKQTINPSILFSSQSNCHKVQVDRISDEHTPGKYHEKQSWKKQSNDTFTSNMQSPPPPQHTHKCNWVSCNHFYD